MEKHGKPKKDLRCATRTLIAPGLALAKKEPRLATKESGMIRLCRSRVSAAGDGCQKELRKAKGTYYGRSESGGKSVLGSCRLRGRARRKKKKAERRGNATRRFAAFSFFCSRFFLPVFFLLFPLFAPLFLPFRCREIVFSLFGVVFVIFLVFFEKAFSQVEKTAQKASETRKFHLAIDKKRGVCYNNKAPNGMPCRKVKIPVLSRCGSAW